MTTSPAPKRSGDRQMLLVTRIVAALIVLLHIWAAAVPASDNWGVHLFAFLPAGMRIAGILLMLAMLLPSSPRHLLKVTELLSDWWAAQSAGTRRAVGAALIAAGALCFLLAGEGITFLGDGFGYLRRLPAVKSVGEIPSVFSHEPLSGYLLWKVFGALNAMAGSAGALAAFRFVSIACGVGFLIALRYFIPMLAGTPADRPALFAFVAAAGGTQLFFGYVETYAPAYAGYVLFLASGILYLRGKIPLLVPSLLFAVLFVCYFGMLAFAPVLALLCLDSIRKGSAGAAAVAILAAAAAAALLLALCGYAPATFLGQFGGAGSHIVPLVGVKSEWQGYTMFSYRHLLELANVQLLCSPFALAVFAAVLMIQRRSIPWENAEWRFVFLNAICGLLMTAIFQCDIGMSRDWDLLAVFTLGTVVAAGYLLVHTMRDAAMQRGIMLVIAVISSLHVAAFVAVNASEARAIPRFTTLVENSLWGRKAFTVYEELAMFYRERNDLRTSAEYYRRFLEHDSANSRVLGNLADVLRASGDEEGERAATERAVALGTQVPAMYFNLGVMYGRSGRYDEAIGVMSRGLLLDPHRPDILNSVGAFYMQGKNACDEALPWFRRAMELDSTYALAYLNSGICAYRLGNDGEAAYDLTRFLRMEPQYPKKAQVLEILEQLSRRK